MVDYTLKNYNSIKELALKGRYITLKDISPLIDGLNPSFKVSELGLSENKQLIHLITIGNGPTKVLMWSQMHGNESTTTRAVFDLLNYLTKESDAQTILDNCTLYIIPMLNPDGSQLYTRVNYNKVDLNRDAQVLSQLESKVFKKIVDKIQPDIAFNLHGQRTIFSAGETNKSAIVSFLSPASDPERTITTTRKVGMRIISEMNKTLQQEIPNCVGRYDDGFNINCTGDTMEDRGVSTILFEAGHFPKDYEREETRRLIFLSLITGLHFIAKTPKKIDGYEGYFDIPENGKLFKDIILRNIQLNNSKIDISLQYEEKLVGNTLSFLPKVAEISSQITDYGHLEYNGMNVKIQLSKEFSELKVGDEIDFLIIENEKFSEFPIIK